MQQTKSNNNCINPAIETEINYFLSEVRVLLDVV